VWTSVRRGGSPDDTEMSQRVITISDLRNVVGELRLSKGTIVTPAARDHADARGIKIVFSDSAPPSRAEQSDRGRPISDIARRIDHTLLHPDAVESDILNLCVEARDHGFAAVCVNPIWVASATKALQGGSVHVCAVVGFPTGAHATAIKAAEAEVCAKEGAQEIDMVANAGWLKDGRSRDYTAEIAILRTRVGAGIILKVIIEAGLLTPEQIIRAATLAAQAGCDFVKTSTGLYGKARIEDVQLLRRALPAPVKIKAAGGIRTAVDAIAMIDAGAERIGTSNSIAIVWEARK